jgi:hypothetical protein
MTIIETMKKLKSLDIDSNLFRETIKDYTIISIHAIYNKTNTCNILIGFEYIICNNGTNENIYFEANGKNNIFIINKVELLK